MFADYTDFTVAKLPIRMSIMLPIMHIIYERANKNLEKEKLSV